MNLESLLAPLMASKCNNALPLSAILECKTKEELNGEILVILQRRNFHQFKQFLQCLHDTGQDDIFHQLRQGKYIICLSKEDNLYWADKKLVGTLKDVCLTVICYTHSIINR